MSLQEAFDAGFDAVKGYVDDALSALERRLAAMEQRLADAHGGLAEQKQISQMLLDRPPFDPVALAGLEDVIKARIAAQEERIAAMPLPAPLPDVAALVRDAVSAAQEALRGDMARALADAVAGLPPPERGADADPADIARMVAEAIEPVRLELLRAVPQPKDGVGLAGAVIDRHGNLVVTLTSGATVDLGCVVGRDADADAIALRVRSELEGALKAALDAIPVPEVPQLPDIAGMVRDAVAALPPAEPGRSVSLDDVRPVIVAEVERAFAALPPPKDGAPGKLPVAKAWDGSVAYEAEVRTHDGALWQALRDTGREPGGADWICLAVAGRPGKDADEIAVCGTYDPDAAYRRLNVVALNGGAFISRTDDPGACPGEGWQQIAMRGKPGLAVKGDKGDSVVGPPGPGIVGMSVDGEGLLTVTNGDGSIVRCDLYDLLRKLKG